MLTPVHTASTLTLSVLPTRELSNQGGLDTVPPVF